MTDQPVKHPDLLTLLRQLEDGEHSDLSVAHDGRKEIIRLRAELEQARYHNELPYDATRAQVAGWRKVGWYGRGTGFDPSIPDGMVCRLAYDDHTTAVKFERPDGRTYYGYVGSSNFPPDALAGTPSEQEALAAEFSRQKERCDE